MSVTKVLHLVALVFAAHIMRFSEVDGQTHVVTRSDTEKRHLKQITQLEKEMEMNGQGKDMGNIKMGLDKAKADLDNIFEDRKKNEDQKTKDGQSQAEKDQIRKDLIISLGKVGTDLENIKKDMKTMMTG